MNPPPMTAEPVTGRKLARPSALVAAVMLLSSLAVLFPFRHDLSVVYRFWDGPLYTYVAKTFYAIPVDHPFVEYKLPPIYFAAHLPLYPLLIRVASWLTFGNLLPAMLLVSLLFSVLSAVLFYHLLVKWRLVHSPLWTALLFCFLPPRWLLYHSVGATEPLFLCLIFATFLAYLTERPALVAFFVMLASVTRITGVLLIPVFCLCYLRRKEWVRTAMIAGASAGIVCVFLLYQGAFHDFWAYFRWNAGQNRIVDPHPFAIFRLYAMNINFHSTELYLWTYLVSLAGTLMLWKRKELLIYGLIFFAFHTMVYSTDLSRFILVMAPFSLLVAFDPILTLKPVRWTAPLVLYLGYLYAWGWIPLNACSPAAYQKLLQALAQ